MRALRKAARLLLVVACSWTGCKSAGSEPFAHVSQPRLSPSKRYRLVIFEEHDGQAQVHGFRIEDPSGQVLFSPPRRWATRHRVLFLWDEAERVWVYSSDVGTLLWQAQSDTQWQEQAYRESGLAPPPALRELLPR
jgi:hypothetical protein